MSDGFEGLLEAARAGAEWAWERIYRDLAPTVIGYLRARGHPDPEAVCGEAFVTIVRDIHLFTGDAEKFRSWVFVTAHRRMLDDFRRRSRRPEYLTEHDAFTHLPDPADPEASGLDSARMAELRAHLDALTPEQREVVLLRVLGGLTIDEVAAAMGRQPGAVKALQRRGLAALRRRLEAEER